MLTPHQLTCNHQTAPLGMDDPRPVFSWHLASPRRGQSQTAYHLLVASSPEMLARHHGDLWNTGQVMSEQSIQVRYAGRPLESRRRYYWMVKVWDGDGNESEWSAPAWFEMGLLEPSDWLGQWISNPEGSWASQRPAPYLRKTFLLKQRVRQARVYICGLGYHELYLNGSRVGDHVLDPAFTRYDRRALYVTHDVTGMIQPGENVFGVILGNGLYNQSARDAWAFEKAPWRAAPRLRFQADLELEDGSRIVLSSDASWKTCEGPIRFDGTRLGEVYDARLELPGWNAPGYDDANWVPARLVDGWHGKLSAQSLPPVKVTAVLRPVKLWHTPGGSTVFDLGRNFTGWVRLRLHGPAGTQVRLSYGERLAPDGSVDRSNIDNLVFEGEVQVDRYILKGDGEEAYEPRFTYHGFQYVEVEGAPGELSLDDLEGRVVHTAFDRAGSFSSSSDVLNSLQSCTEWSYTSNFVGYPSDCPHREKNGWTGDAHLAAEAGLYNFHAETAYGKWLDDLADEQREDGALPGIVPTSGWGYEWGNGPCWDSAAVLIPWYLYLYCGDRAALERAYPMMRRYLDYLGEKSHGGELIALGLGDWVPPYGQPEDYTAPLRLLSSAYFYMDARVAAQTAALLGHAEDAARYTAWAGRLFQQFNQLFYDPISGLYASGSQTAQAMALWAGLVERDNRLKVSRQLVAAIRMQKGRINAGIHGAKAAINALSESGFHAQAYRLITQPQYPGWVWWLSQGATTLWETWNGDSSRNHIMFGDISTWFYKYLAGIRPDPEFPGFKRVIIRPYLAEGLDWVTAEHDGPYGLIRSAWQRQEHGEGCHYRLEVSLPANTGGLVYLPKCDPASLRLDNVTLQEAGIRPITRRIGGPALPIGSGDWVFTGELSQ